MNFCVNYKTQYFGELIR